ncbi:MAG: molybdenum cofactor guanylyltransferase [Actinobacteria bacterium]|nr:molybdenum cofactor guanylyltransferase [Actinomycetota bacterium]
MLGAVLTGGRSTRMGRDKTEVIVAGRTMLDWVGAALAEVTGRVVVLGPDREGWESWSDAVHAEGPLAGIATALTRTEDDQVLVVAVDQPFVLAATLAGLAALATEVPVVPVDRDGVRQVTCAVYPAVIATQAVEEAAAGGSVQSLLDRVSFHPVTPEEWGRWGEDGRSWFSVDTLDRLEDGLSRFRP